MSKPKEKPLPAYSHDSITQTDSAGNPTHITHYKEGKVIGHTYITYDATTGNIKNMWSDFQPRLRPMPVPVILLDKNMLIGNIDVALSTRTLTKHDNKTYKTAVFDASASGNLVAAVAGKVIKLHALTIQAQGTVVVNLNNGSGGASLMEWSFQAREGAVVPTANAPAYWAKTSVNTALYVALSAAVTVTITAIYSDDDAS